MPRSAFLDMIPGEDGSDLQKKDVDSRAATTFNLEYFRPLQMEAKSLGRNFKLFFFFTFSCYLLPQRIILLII